MKLIKYDYDHPQYDYGSGNCPLCSDGGGGTVYDAIWKDKHHNALAGFWCDECDAWWPKAGGFYVPSADKPMGNHAEQALIEAGFDIGSCKPYILVRDE